MARRRLLGLAVLVFVLLPGPKNLEARPLASDPCPPVGFPAPMASVWRPLGYQQPNSFNLSYCHQFPGPNSCAKDASGHAIMHPAGTFATNTFVCRADRVCCDWQWVIRPQSGAVSGIDWTIIPGDPPEGQGGAERGVINTVSLDGWAADVYFCDSIDECSSDPRTDPLDEWTLDHRIQPCPDPACAGDVDDWSFNDNCEECGTDWALVLVAPAQPVASPSPSRTPAPTRTPAPPTQTPRPPTATPTGPTPTPFPTLDRPVLHVGGVWAEDGSEWLSSSWAAVGCYSGNFGEGPIPGGPAAPQECYTEVVDGIEHVRWRPPGQARLYLNRWYANYPLSGLTHQLIDFQPGEAPNSCLIWHDLCRFRFNGGSQGEYGSTFIMTQDGPHALKVMACPPPVAACIAADPRVPEAPWVFAKWLHDGIDMNNPANYYHWELFSPFEGRNSPSAAFVIPGESETPPPTPTFSPTPTPTVVQTPCPSCTPTPAPTFDSNYAWRWPICGSDWRVAANFDHNHPMETDSENEFRNLVNCDPGDVLHKEWWDGSEYHLDCYDPFTGARNRQWPRSPFQAEVEYDQHSGTDFTPASGAGGEAIYVAVADGEVTYAGMTAGNIDGCEHRIERAYAGQRVVRIMDGRGFIANYYDVNSIVVERGQHVSRGQIVAAGSTGHTEYSEGLHFEATERGVTGRNWPNTNFDQFGFANFVHEDTWEEDNGIVSRQLLPGTFSRSSVNTQACPLVCSGANTARETVDDGDPGFSLGGTADVTTAQACTECYGGDFRTMRMGDYDPSDSSDFGFVRWQSSLPPGKYKVEVYLNSWAKHADGPGLTYMMSSRYKAGDHTVRVSQIQYPQWMTLGAFQYDAPPFVQLGDNAYDQTPRESGYIDSFECSWHYIDAVRFTRICAGPDSPLAGPPATKTPPCWLPSCGPVGH